jgi:type III secretory pathway component EscR
MKRIHRYFGSLVLAAALVTPVVLVAEASAQEASIQVRVYDRHHKDYHNWDDHEDRAYRRYLTEQHREYREYNRENSRRQDNYWKWRHNHPDHDDNR